MTPEEIEAMSAVVEAARSLSAGGSVIPMNTPGSKECALRDALRALDALRSPLPSRGELKGAIENSVGAAVHWSTAEYCGAYWLRWVADYLAAQGGWERSVLAHLRALATELEKR